MIVELSNAFGKPILETQPIEAGALISANFKGQPALALRVNLGPPNDLAEMWLILAVVPKDALGAPVPHPLAMGNLSPPFVRLDGHLLARPVDTDGSIAAVDEFISGALVVGGKDGPLVCVQEKLGAQIRKSFVNLGTGVEQGAPARPRAIFPFWELCLKTGTDSVHVLARFGS